MLQIIKKSRDFSEVEQYLMTLDNAIKTLKDVEDNTVIPVAGYLEFTDTKQNGEEVEILSIITPNKEVYSCQSATFKKSLHNIVDIMKDKEFAIIKTSGQTKAGRSFIDCRLDVSSVK